MKIGDTCPHCGAGFVASESRLNGDTYCSGCGVSGGRTEPRPVEDKFLPLTARVIIKAEGYEIGYSDGRASRDAEVAELKQKISQLEMDKDYSYGQ